MKPPYTLKPFKTKSGALVRATGWGKVPNTTEWDKLKKKEKSYWWVAIQHIETKKYQYWIYNYVGRRIKILKNCPE